MPIYEYQCPKCGKFEQIQKFSDEPLSECPHCEKKGEKSPVERLISHSAFHLKGSGWYQSDYGAKSTGPKVTTDSESKDTPAPTTEKSAEPAPSSPISDSSKSVSST